MHTLLQRGLIGAEIYELPLSFIVANNIYL